MPTNLGHSTRNSKSCVLYSGNNNHPTEKRKSANQEKRGVAELVSEVQVPEVERKAIESDEDYSEELEKKAEQKIGVEQLIKGESLFQVGKGKE